MKKLLTSRPILSYLLLTFAITYFFWFLPVLLPLPKDIALGVLLIGGCGPMLAGYGIMVARSGAGLRLGSVSIFTLIFLVSALTIFLRIYFTGAGLPDVNGKIPTESELTPAGALVLGVVCFILAFHASQATNAQLKENHIRSFLFERTKWPWYVLAFLLFPVMALISFAIGKLTGTKTTEYVMNVDPVLWIGVLSTFFFFGGNEEFGWRGFMQKEVQKN